MQRLMMIIAVIICLWGCTQARRVAFDDYVNNQASYKNSNILITANIKQLLDNYEIIKGKDIEVTAPIIHFEERDAPSWYLVIGSEEKNIRAYETNYRRFIPSDAIYLARLAKKDGGEVVVRGSLMDSGIELDQLTYGEIIVNTNVPSSAS